MALGARMLALWRLARPEVWMVTFLPVYGGFVLASRDLVPGQRELGLAWRELRASGWDTAAAHAGPWWAEAWPVALALAVMGPLLWTATLLQNDVHDLAGDRLNPRKARSPLVQGLVTRGWAQAVAYAAAAASLAAALPLGWTFTAVVAACLALAWAYSTPPLRLKTRPGADVAVNALGVGALAAFAGWSLAAPLGEFPFLFLGQALLVAVAVYVPTTLVDHDADKAAGYLTLATHLGPQAAYRVGWWAWVMAQAGALALALADTWIPRAMAVPILAFAPLMLWEYHRFIGNARDGPARVEGVILCSLTFLCVIALWALLYTDTWRP